MSAKQNTITKPESLYREIRNKICLLEYPPSMALREEALAEEYGVSRTPIRQVLQRLEYDGLVINQPGAGVIVTTVDLRSLREVYALRLKLADFIGEMMTNHFPAEDALLLQEILEQVQAMHDHYDTTALGRFYHQFHGIMNRNISNRPLQQICDQLFYQTARVWLEILPELDWEEEVDIICEEISDVIAAVHEDNMLKVGQIRKDHMVRLLARNNNYLGSANME
ncbi:MAG: GntR family transcriptional regulator [Aggregatilineales bacterium]